ARASGKQPWQQAFVCDRSNQGTIHPPLLSGSGDGSDLPGDGGGFRGQRLALHHDCTAPPSSTMPWPLTPLAVSEQRKAVIAATSAAVINRPCGLKPSRILRASCSERPVLDAMFAVDASVISVCTCPGQPHF